MKEHTTELSKEDFKLFLEALQEDEPNEELRKAVRRHNELINDGEVD